MKRQARASRATNQPTPNVYYEDPAHPGTSRHVECFRKAGINPTKAGYQRTKGPCSVCSKVALQVHDLRFQQAMVEWIAEIGETLEKTGELGFELAKGIRRRTGTGVIESFTLAQAFPNLLAQFQRAWNCALKAASTKRSLSADCQVPAATIYVLTSAPDPRIHLVIDPTNTGLVFCASLESTSGFLLHCADRIAHLVLRHRAALSKGPDPDGLAVRGIADFKASPKALSTVVETYLLSKPTQAEINRAKSLSQRWRTRRCRKGG